MADRGNDPKKKRGIFLRIIGKFWRLKEERSAAEFDQEKSVKNTFKELIIYVIFLTTVCLISFSMSTETMFNYTDVIMNLLVRSEFEDKDWNPKTFEGITTVADFWKYAKNPLLDGLYWSTWYNDETPLPKIEGADGLILYENLLVGCPRLRQLRVKSDSCKVNPEFDNFISDCYSEYSEDAEETHEFSKKKEPNTTDAGAWEYSQDLEGYDYWGKLGWYPERGFAIDLSREKAVTFNILNELENAIWIRRGARAVFIDFTLYNANINLFCVVRLAVEFPATGGAIPRAVLKTQKLIRYFTAYDKVIFGFEIVFLVFIFYYLVEEIIELIDVGFRYFFQFWNLVDTALIVCAFICIGLNVVRYKMVNDKLQHLDLTKHISFSKIANLQEVFNNVVAILVFFAWVKVFKFISFNKTMTQLSTTLSRCAKDLLGFFIMFAIVFIAFTQLGYLLFGTQVKDFSTFLNSFFTLFRIILGDFDFHQLEQANRVLGPVFFMLFVFFVFFVLINMFLAIINDTYSEVKSDMAKQVDVFIMSDYVKQLHKKVKDKMKKTEKFDQEDEEDANLTDKRMGCAQWKKLMVLKGFAEEDVDNVFDKYEIDTDRSLVPTEQKRLLRDLQQTQAEVKQDQETKKLETEFDESEPQKDAVALDEYLALTKRVDRLETSMGSIITNIDAVLAQLATLKF